MFAIQRLIRSMKPNSVAEGLCDGVSQNTTSSNQPAKGEVRPKTGQIVFYVRRKALDAGAWPSLARSHLHLTVAQSMRHKPPFYNSCRLLTWIELHVTTPSRTTTAPA